MAVLAHTQSMGKHSTIDEVTGLVWCFTCRAYTDTHMRDLAVYRSDSLGAEFVEAQVEYSCTVCLEPR